MLIIIACDSAELFLGWGLNIVSRHFGSLSIPSSVCLHENESDLLTPSRPEQRGHRENEVHFGL